ncbi:hypothetical protein LVJ82_18460 [Vitreoscilla massiliensis]|uniref:Uncharacterized protein n=1 Tax=Vitreoscilla massiliensis TaxID=1689272 RepID=A0ABY4E245_9NEIS|nr:hypothetical protein [Vitreoscilla massiliensis]UOO89398.1 hypothetical protein LVJ82_18460 [Vitreoscilla massiliensis]
MNKIFTHEHIISMLGTQTDTAQLKAMLDYFGLSVGNISVVDKDFMRRGISLKHIGAFFFLDKLETHPALNHHVLGAGPYVLEQLTLTGYRDKYQKFCQFQLQGRCLNRPIKMWLTLSAQPIIAPTILPTRSLENLMATSFPSIGPKTTKSDPSLYWCLP